MESAGGMRAFELARRLERTGVTAYCFHPGLVASGFKGNNGLVMNLAITMLWPLSRSVEKGAETLVWLANAPDVELTNGGYHVDMEWRPPSPEGQSIETAQRLWDMSEANARRGKATKARHDLALAAARRAGQQSIERGHLAEEALASLPRGST